MLLKKFHKIHRKTPVPESLFNKVAGRRPATLFKKRLWHKCFPLNFVKFLRTPFLQNMSGRLLLENVPVSTEQKLILPLLNSKTRIWDLLSKSNFNSWKRHLDAFSNSPIHSSSICKSISNENWIIEICLRRARVNWLLLNFWLTRNFFPQRKWTMITLLFESNLYTNEISGINSIGNSKTFKCNLNHSHKNR